MDGWDYAEGYHDSCIYRNFLSQWITDAIPEMIVEKRKEILPTLTEQLEQAFVLEPSIGDYTILEKIEFLVKDQTLLEQSDVPSGITDWDLLKQNMIKSWKKNQEKWIWSYAVNHHAIEGDILIANCRNINVKKIPLNILRIAQTAANTIKSKYSNFDLLCGCNSSEEFEAIICNWYDFIEKMSHANEYKGMDGEITAKKFMKGLDEIKSTIPDKTYWPSIKAILISIGPFEAKPIIRALNKVELSRVNEFYAFLNSWNKLYQLNKIRMENENQQKGHSSRLVLKSDIDELIGKINHEIQALEEMF